jgi:NADPH:quinone reductase-like Zn-dependent oxidoreductase
MTGHEWEAGMKAVMIKKYGGPEVLELVDIPEPKAAEDEVLVRVGASSVNPIDWLIRDGGAKSFIKLSFPAILGCDLAGEVVAIGARVKRVAVGDQVFAMMPHDWGAQAELVALREDLVVPKPKGLTVEQAAALPTAALTALQALRHRGQLKAGEHALINGASGGVGMAAVQIAKALGATVTAVCSEASFELVKSLGADRWIDYRTKDFADGNDRYDLIFDCVGNQPYSKAKRVLRGRRVHLTTQPTVGTFIRQFFNPLFGVKVFGLLTNGNGPDLEYTKSLVDAGKLRPVIDKTFPIALVAEAHRYSKSGRAKGKIILTFQS